MQTAHSPAHPAQLQNGWAFPVATQPLAPGPARAVTGGGAPAAPTTVTRMRWGRVLLMLVGAGLVAFGAWTATAGTGGGAATEDTARVVSGGGSDGGALDIAPPRTAAPTAAPKATPKPRATKRPRAHRAAAATAASRSTGGRGGGSNARRGIVAGGGLAAASASAATGGGTNARGTGELPMTGLSTWIAGVLGALLLTLGVCVHVNAVRLGMTAMLYRRGILLRPVECARLAHERGVPRLRVALSDLLHRLLEEPAARGDFVRVTR